MNVVVVSEYFPSAKDPNLGIWVLRQAQSVQKLGVEVQVLALNRVLPPLSALKPLFSMKPSLRELREWRLNAKKVKAVDSWEGIPVRYVRFISPPRPVSYGSWAKWIRKPLERALSNVLKERPFQLVHAHYAAPTAAAVSRWCKNNSIPLITSIHGGDILDVATRSKLGMKLVVEGIDSSAVVLCNSNWSQDKAQALHINNKGLRVVRLGTDIPLEKPEKNKKPTIVTVAHLIPRKKHADVLLAFKQIVEDGEDLSYWIIGDGPQREKLEQNANKLAIDDHVKFFGSLPHRRALDLCRKCHLFVMPSENEAFGVAYIEAMAAGLPAIGCKGEGGPEEISAQGGGMLLVPPSDPEQLAKTISETISSGEILESMSLQARQNVSDNFSWDRCGKETLSIYKDVVEGRVDQ